MGFMIAAFTAALGLIGFRTNQWIATIARREIIQRALAADLENRVGASRHRDCQTCSAV